MRRRSDPALLRELIADEHLGEVLAVNMTMVTGGVLERGKARLWDRDKTEGVSALTVRGIHTMDVMCWCLSDFVEVSGKVTTQVKQWRVTETGEMVDVDTPDNVMVNGLLRSGAIASVHVGTVPYNASGWRMEIFGRKGTIRATSKGSPQRDANTLLGAQNGASLEPLPVPARFVEVPEAMPAGPPRNVGHLYLRMARAIRDGVPSTRLHVALNRHRSSSDKTSVRRGRTVALPDVTIGEKRWPVRNDEVKLPCRSDAPAAAYPAAHRCPACSRARRARNGLRDFQDVDPGPSSHRACVYESRDATAP